jgi:hypothetical protein
MAIFVVILEDYSNGFDNHLMHFHAFFSAPSISKMVLGNFSGLVCLVSRGVQASFVWCPEVSWPSSPGVQRSPGLLRLLSSLRSLSVYIGILPSS